MGKDEEHESTNVTGDPASTSLLSENNPFMKGEIPKIIFRNAIKCKITLLCICIDARSVIPKDLNFRLQFLQIFQQFEDTSSGQNLVYETIERDFPTNPEALKILAERKLSSGEGSINNEKEAMSTFENALKTEVIQLLIIWCSKNTLIQVQRVVLYLFGLNMWISLKQLWWKLKRRRRSVRSEEETLNNDLKMQIEFWRKALGNLFNRAHNERQCSEALYSKWIHFLLDLGEVKEAANTATLATTAFPQSNSLWLLRLDIVIKDRPVFSPRKRQSDDEVRKLFQEALKHVGGEQSVPLWNRYLDFCITMGTEWNEVLNSYKVMNSSDMILNQLLFRMQSLLVEIAKVQLSFEKSFSKE